MVDKDEVIKLLTHEVLSSNPLDAVGGSHPEDFKRMLESILNKVLADNLSFAVRNSHERIVASSVNFDLETEFSDSASYHDVIDAILDEVAKPVYKELLAEGGRWMRSSLVAISSSMLPRDRVRLLKLIGDEEIRVAKDNGFAGIVSVNGHAATQVSYPPFKNVTKRTWVCSKLCACGCV
jgi:hypothetical protein